MCLSRGGRGGIFVLKKISDSLAIWFFALNQGSLAKNLWVLRNEWSSILRSGTWGCVRLPLGGQSRRRYLDWTFFYRHQRRLLGETNSSYLDTVDKKHKDSHANSINHHAWSGGKTLRPQHASCNEITAQDLLASVRPFIAPTRWIVIANRADRHLSVRAKRPVFSLYYNIWN